MKRPIGLTLLNFAASWQAGWNRARPALPPPPPAASRRPGGFTLLAVILALFVLGQVMDTLDHPPLPLSFGSVLALLGTVLSAVAAEALWTVRPWASRACGALAVLALGAYFAGAAQGHGGVEAMVVGALVAAFLAALVRYVDAHVQAAQGPTVVLQVRRPVPGPWTRWRP